MKALIRQELLADHIGYIPRRDVIAAIARVRHRLQHGLAAGSLLPKVSPEQLLLDLCREIGLDNLETVEAVGAEIAINHTIETIMPAHDSLEEEDRWLSTHADSEFDVKLGGSDQ